MTHAQEATAGSRIRRLGARAVPSHWTFFLASVSAACLVVLTVTGTFLMFYFDPSNEPVIYDGSYPLLRGVEMTKAFESVLHVSLEVRGGLLMRQAHHWAALILPASLMLHLLSIFFTGGFRRPRRWNWVLLNLVFLLVLVGGWSGYGLPDDTLSGTGLRIFEGILLSIPVAGMPVAWLMFGGEFPGEIIERLYWLHVLVVPIGLAVLFAIRFRMAGKRRPAQFAGPGRTEDNVVGPAASNVTARATGLFIVTTGWLFAMGGTLTIAPVWRYGPASSSDASAGSQPDWYTGFLDGALRLAPPGWEATGLGGTWALGVLIPQVVAGAFLLIVMIYPFLEARITGDQREHNLLDRPRDAPNRTAIGVAGLVFYGTLWASASTDVVATQLSIAFETQVYALRFTLVAGPFIAFWVTRQICLGLQARDRDDVEHGYETGILRRDPAGGYDEVHAPLPAAQLWRLAPSVRRRDPSRPDHDSLEAGDQPTGADERSS